MTNYSGSSEDSCEQSSAVLRAPPIKNIKALSRAEASYLLELISGVFGQKSWMHNHSGKPIGDIFPVYNHGAIAFRNVLADLGVDAKIEIRVRRVEYAKKPVDISHLRLGGRSAPLKEKVEKVNEERMCALSFQGQLWFNSFQIEEDQECYYMNKWTDRIESAPPQSRGMEGFKLVKIGKWEDKGELHRTVLMFLDNSESQAHYWRDLASSMSTEVSHALISNSSIPLIAQEKPGPRL